MDKFCHRLFIILSFSLPNFKEELMKTEPNVKNEGEADNTLKPQFPVKPVPGFPNRSQVRYLWKKLENEIFCYKFVKK